MLRWIQCFLFVSCSALLISAGEWYDLGVDKPDRPSCSLYDCYKMNEQRSSPCGQCTQDFDSRNRWSGGARDEYCDAFGQSCRRISFQGPVERYRPWEWPLGDDYPDCGPGCCSIKARIVFCSVFYSIHSYCWVRKLGVQRPHDVPSCMLPDWGGYYWHYDAALDACERYVWDEWDRAIQSTEEAFRELSEEMAAYQAGQRRPLYYTWGRYHTLKPSYGNYFEYKLSTPELEQCLVEGPEILRLKRQMRLKELALISEARKRIHGLFQQLNRCALRELAQFDEDTRAFSEVLLEAGLLAFEEGDPILAWEYLTELIENWDPDDSCRVLQEVRSLYGKACLETHEYLEAVDLLSQLLKEDPTNKEAHLDRAQAYFELGFFELAKSDFLESGTALKHIDRGRARLDMAVGLIDGITEGIGQALKELGPSLLDSAKGMGHGLWACATDPQQVSIDLVNAALDAFEFVKGHSTGEIFDTIAPEISGLVRSWDYLSPQEKGEGMGRIIGRYGTDVLLLEGGIGAIKRVRNLKHLDVCATLDVVASGGQRSERLITQAATYGEKRTFVADEHLKALGSSEAKGGIYLLRDPKTKKVMRSGRTNDFVRRQHEHKRHPETHSLNFQTLYETDVRNEQRGLEKIVDEQYKPPLNRIKPVSDRNPKRAIYPTAP